MGVSGGMLFNPLAGWGLLADATSLRVIFMAGIGYLTVCMLLGLAALRQRKTSEDAHMS